MPYSSCKNCNIFFNGGNFFLEFNSLNISSASTIQHGPELKMYYKRKVAEGKNKMCAINTVRCKVLSRAFSVIKRQTPYVSLFAFAA